MQAEEQRESRISYNGNAGTRASYIRKRVLAGIGALTEAEDDDGVLTHDAFAPLAAARGSRLE